MTIGDEQEDEQTPLYIDIELQDILARSDEQISMYARLACGGDIDIAHENFAHMKGFSVAKKDILECHLDPDLSPLIDPVNWIFGDEIPHVQLHELVWKLVEGEGGDAEGQERYLKRYLQQLRRGIIPAGYLYGLLYDQVLQSGFSGFRDLLVSAGYGIDRTLDLLRFTREYARRQVPWVDHAKLLSIADETGYEEVISIEELRTLTQDLQTVVLPNGESQRICHIETYGEDLVLKQVLVLPVGVDEHQEFILRAEAYFAELMFTKGYIGIALGRYGLIKVFSSSLGSFQLWELIRYGTILEEASRNIPLLDRLYANRNLTETQRRLGFWDIHSGTGPNFRKPWLTGIEPIRCGYIFDLGPYAVVNATHAVEVLCLRDSIHTLDFDPISLIIDRIVHMAKKEGL